jgi:hypothetical protein
MRKRIAFAVATIVVLTVMMLPLVTSIRAQAPAAQVGRTERTAWYFYRVKWGFQDEFVTLFARNHLLCFASR